ncbi:polysaccharide deacetylase family protein [Actinomadura roseirufa]|uniref:polysaccharide deacetylase family protein n=1 Tax=Actinomadura roseirufa TaxID=2094049 RepID=UPI00104158D4|nr:polysaccharide deacetylase family protein [Actinomadura roseirufa]
MIRRDRTRTAGAPRPGRPALRRHLTELGFGVLALAAIVPLARGALLPAESRAQTPRARTVVTDAMLRPAYPANPCRAGRVALTFDDGPDVYTPQILTVLRAYKARATFYMMGKKVAARPDLVRAVIADGHAVENHSWDHPHMADLEPAAIRRQLADTSAAIAAAGAPRPTLFRPPFGNTGPAVNAEARALGMRVVRWSVDTNDWRGRAPADITATVLGKAAPGAVVLMHDGVAASASTIRALPGIIDGLRARGFCTSSYAE